MRRFAIGLAALVLAAGCLGGVGDEDASDQLEDPSQRVERQLTPDDATASEVSIDANPADPGHLVAAANNQGGFEVYVSTDAGERWESHRFEPSDVRAGATDASRFQAVSDPVVAFGPDGSTVYLAGLAYLPTSAVFVAASTDGGATFDEVHLVDESDIAAHFNDKEWLGVNPETGTLLVAWQKEPALDQLRGVEHRTGVDADVGWIVVSRSTDGGVTWSDPVQISRGMHSNGTAIAFTEGGQAHILWVNYEEDSLDHATSTDDGETWKRPQPVASVDTVPPYPRYQRMHTLPALAADENGQALYAVWHDDRNGDADVYAVASPDAGRTWGPQVRVNDDPMDSGSEQIYPWADVAPDGALHVSWYDTREDPDVPLLRFYHARAAGPSLDVSENAPASNATFRAFCEEGPEPTGEGGACDEHRSLGDYTSIAVTSEGVFPVWADGRGDQSRIFASRLLGGPE